MWGWENVPKYRIQTKIDKASGVKRYVILRHDGFGDMSYVCDCYSSDNANAILELLYKDMEDEKNGSRIK